jgi:integrase
MSAFGGHLQDYLSLRRSLGHQLTDPARLLGRFVADLDARGASRITVEAALDWVQRPDADPSSSVWLHRMTAVRGFARYMSGIDPHNEIPPLGLVTYRRRWRQPFIYSEDDVVALIDEVPRLIPTPLRAATFQTMIGLLAATGVRIGEVIALGRADVNLGERVMAVRASKFNKSREVPLHHTTVDALASYAALRDGLVSNPSSPTFFVSRKGTAVIYADFSEKFRALVRSSGVSTGSPTPPTIHGLRHSFAVSTLVRWHREGQDVGSLLPRLSTYLGHREPTKGSQTIFTRHRAPGVVFVGARRPGGAASVCVVRAPFPGGGCAGVLVEGDA